MKDPRFQALAAQLAGYSTALRPGDRVLLELTDIPEEMGIALIREARHAGAMPFLRLNQSRLNREMLSGATEEQYGIIGRHRLAEMEDMDAYIEIRGGGNAFELSSVPQENMAAAMKALNPVSQRRIRHTRWCGLRWPSGGMAQQASMSTEEFEDFYFRTCLMDYAALRPAMAGACPLKKETAEKGIDLMMVRELTGGIYFGEKGVKDTDLGPAAYDIEQYAEEEVRRIAKVAFDMAMKRSKHVTSVDKANVLESSRLWRRVVTEVAKDYPEVTLDHLYVDNAAMQLVRNPRQFDVIVTSNIFGDILSDEASQITGSIGMLPSASLAQGNFGMYEPVHGSAPDIAGQDKANPMATILSAAMMLRYTFGLGQEADAIENAVKSVLDQGYRTPDLFAGEGTLVGTAEMGRRIAEAI